MSSVPNQTPAWTPTQSRSHCGQATGRFDFGPVKAGLPKPARRNGKTNLERPRVVVVAVVYVLSPKPNSGLDPHTKSLSLWSGHRPVRFRPCKSGLAQTCKTERQDEPGAASSSGSSSSICPQSQTKLRLGPPHKVALTVVRPQAGSISAL